MPRRAALLLSTMLLPLPGCCTLARLFCGPDTSPWISESYESPEAAVATLLEAVRRDAPDIAYRTLSTGFRRRHQLDSVTAQLFWQRLREEIPGLHVLGYATVPPPETRTPDRASFVVEAAGIRLRIDTERASFQQVIYRRPDGSSGGGLAPLDAWPRVAHVTPIEDEDRDHSQLTLGPLDFEHEGLDEVPLDAIERAGLVRLWRVAELSQLDG